MLKLLCAGLSTADANKLTPQHHSSSEQAHVKRQLFEQLRIYRVHLVFNRACFSVTLEVLHFFLFSLITLEIDHWGEM